jgi:ATP-dependent helicase/nuclease subunit B
MPSAEQKPVRPSLYTLPFGVDLCSATVDAIFERVGDDALALSETLIFLPNNRAIKSITEAFVRRASPGLLLPRLVAVGDLALDEVLGPLIDPLNNANVIDPVIAPMQRLLLLTKIITSHRQAVGDIVTPGEALRLAHYLGTVIDELEIEEIGFDQLRAIEEVSSFTPDLAAHWQSSYGQLLAMVPEYHDALHRLNCIGPATRRNLLLDQLVQRLRKEPPGALVVAAGISTSAPAIARLMKQIALLPKSMVVLPSIDLDMDDELWNELGPHDLVEGEIRPRPAHESHPQFHLKLLLDRMGFARDEVSLLGPTDASTGETIKDIFCLPAATALWRELPPMRKKLPHVCLITAQDSAEEARAIAVLLRQSLETAGQRAALVTPDRELGVRVGAQLKRWGISVDDSAGTPLLQTPAGMLIMALANGVADRFAPVSLLAIGKHPLVNNGDDRLAWLEHIRLLDLALRGPNTGLGTDAVAKRIDAWVSDKRRNEACDTHMLSTFWVSFSGLLDKLDAFAGARFADVADAIQKLATTLTGGAIWKGTTGRQLASFFDELAQSDTSAIGKTHREAIPTIFAELLACEVVRPPYGGHPRIAIYGLLEARLQQADMVICAGLNEGTWPQLPQPDPWLAPRIRRYLGLSALERNIGLSAHDLATVLGARKVVLSRSQRDRSGPTVASRFLLRIQALFGDALNQDRHALSWARTLETPEHPLKVDKPSPTPKAEQRRVDLSVTDFDQLQADPYAFYASKILRLRTLDAVDEEPGFAWRGTVIHDILEAWAKQDSCDPDKLAARAEALLDNPAVHPMLRALWQPRIVESLKWVAEQTTALREEGRDLLAAEVSGNFEINGVKIKGRADRIDRLTDSTFAIVDYKTGQAPSNATIREGFALQLGLIALMAEAGGIEGASGIAKQFEYWSLAKKPGGGFGQIVSATALKEKDNKITADDFTTFARTKASEAIAKWITGKEAFTAKLHPEYAPYADYDQLMRLQEWDGREPLIEDSAT